MNVTIHVTEQILRKAAHCDNAERSNNCAIALAIREILPTAHVGLDRILLYNTIDINCIDNVIPIPSVATRFIQEFDVLTSRERIEMKPISFDITLPNSFINTINIDEITDVIKNSKSLQLV